jgi:electron transfer flavoprotein alpha subunit
MRIAVCIKQVPVVSALEFDPEQKTLKRENVPTEVSAFDLRALVKAVRLKEAHGGEVVVITMGPAQAREALLECLALGADRAMHLCDRAFAGADTLATARALALALEREPFDLILCGRNSVDAETGQVGAELAELLDLPQITCARTLTIDRPTRTVQVDRQTDAGFETVRARLPVVVSAAEDLSEERFPSKAERDAAATKPCEEVAAAQLDPDISLFGSSGSPTWVSDLRQSRTTRRGKILEAESVDEAAARLARILVVEHGLFGEWTAQEQATVATVPEKVGREKPRDVWVLVETRGGVPRPVVFELLGKASAMARAFSGRVVAVTLGDAVERHAPTLAAHGADCVLVGEDARLQPFDTEVHAALLAAAIRQRQPGVFLLPATTAGRDLAPRVAARLGLGLTGDCIDLGIDDYGRLLQYKPAFGGSVVAPVLSRTFPEMATVRPGMLAAPRPDPSRHATVERLPVDFLPERRVIIIDERPMDDSAGDLDTADVVIGVGKGIGSGGHIARLQPLLDLLDAALCTTRDVADDGWLPRQRQVGLTGRAIAPKLYIGVAIRGAFEHMVGLQRAGVVVGINRTARAPIFKAADYGIVGDYADVVPALCKHLSALKR